MLLDKGGRGVTPCDFGLDFFPVELGNADKNEVILVKTLLGKLHGFSSRSGFIQGHPWQSVIK